MEKTINKNRIFKLFVAVLLLVITAFSAVLGNLPFFSAFADSRTNIYDSTDPLEDLQTDPTFDVRKYPYDLAGRPSLEFFVEYCYSYHTSDRSNYALYIYVYNPQGHTFRDSTMNKIQMAVTHDNAGNPDDFEKYQLQLCGYTKGEHLRKFYKFKVVDHMNDGVSIYEKLAAEGGARVYDVSGIELITEEAIAVGDMNATDYTVAKTYTYTGYAEGYGKNKNDKSTLSCTYDINETIGLDVQHTFWRSETANGGAFLQNQINSVFFSVPNEYLTAYGTLQRIKAEWYEYRTKDILVTNDDAIYNHFKRYLYQKTFEDKDSTFKWQDVKNEENIRKNLYNEKIYYSIGGYDSSIHTGGTVYNWLYNYNFNNDFAKIDMLAILGHTNDTTIANELYYIFKTRDGETIESYDPLDYFQMSGESGGVTTNDLYEHILEYSKTHTSNNDLEIKGGLISSDLFEDTIPESRLVDNEYGKIQRGYSYYDFDADVDIFDLMSYRTEDNSFSDNLRMYGFWAALFWSVFDNDPHYFDVSPILAVRAEDLEGTDAEIANRLYISINAVDDLKAMFENGQTSDDAPDYAGETVFLFRYAVSPYECSDVTVYEPGQALDVEMYKAKQSVFLDFDIIQLTFKDEANVMSTLPVSMSPIDIVSPITAPVVTGCANGGCGCDSPILAWIILLAVIVVLFFVFKYLIKLIKVIGKSEMKTWLKALLIILLIVGVAFALVLGASWLGYLITNLGGLSCA